MQFRKLGLWVVAVGLGWGVASPRAHAGGDYFGNGDGHHGAKSVVASEVVHAYSHLTVDALVNDVSIEVADVTTFDIAEDDDFILQGGRGVGCHVGVTGEPGPLGVLLLLLAFCLGIRRYTRK